ncbi:hypothetical protein [Nostoc sp.]
MRILEPNETPPWLKKEILAKALRKARKAELDRRRRESRETLERVRRL